MKEAILLHGCCDEDEFLSEAYPSPSNSHWIPWLQKRLLCKGFACQTPEMPTPFRPVYKEWKYTFEKLYAENTKILVGHSCGCGFLLRWIGETGANIDHLALVAPWIDPHRKLGDFLSFKIDPGLATHINKIDIFFSTDEPVAGVRESVKDITAKLGNTRLHQFSNMGHFSFEEMKTDAFPLLLSVLTDGSTTSSEYRSEHKTGSAVPD